LNDNIKKGRGLKIAVAVLSILLAVTTIAWITYGSQLQQEEEKYWQPVIFGYHGTASSVTSEAFKITGEEWRITWDPMGTIDVGSTCEVTVYDAYTDSEVRTLSLTYQENEGYLVLSGRFYLKIRFYGNIESWLFDVWEYR